MMKRLRDSDERGQSLVIIVLAMIGLIAFLALVIDGGTAFAERRQMQNAADGGALAGARQLYALYNGSRSAADEQEIYNAVVQYAQANGVSDPADLEAWFIDSSQAHTGTNPLPGNGAIPADAVGVEVTTTTSFPSLFAKVIGRNELSVSALAASMLVEEPGGGDYAIWADSYDCGLNTLNCTGSDISITGSIHSNAGVHSTGSDVTISGAVEHCEDFLGPGASYGSDEPWPPEWCDPTKTYPKPWDGLNIELSRFAPGGDLANAAALDTDPACLGTIGGQDQTSCYHYFAGNFPKLKKDETLLDGLYYVDGKVQINGNDMPAGTVNITIVATGQIKMTNIGANTIVAYSDLDGEGPRDLVLFSSSSPANPCSNKVIQISSSGATWTGIIFAPYGQVSISSSTITTTIAGAIWGYAVDLSGSLQSIIWDENFVEPAVSPQVFLIR